MVDPIEMAEANHRLSIISMNPIRTVNRISTVGELEKQIITIDQPFKVVLHLKITEVSEVKVNEKNRANVSLFLVDRFSE